MMTASEFRHTRLRIDPAHHRYLHELADVLSSTLETPVLLTDENLALIAASQHSTAESTGPMAPFSPERLALPPRALSQLTCTTHAPGVPEIGMPGFWLMPLTVDGRRVAFVWVVENLHPISATQIAHVERTATATMRALVRAGAFAETADADSEPAAELMSDDPGRSDTIIASRAQRGQFSRDARTFAIAIATRPLNDHFATRAELSRVLGSIIERAAASYPPNRRIVAQRGTESVVLIAPFSTDDIDAASHQVLMAAQDLLTRSEQRELYGSWVVGVSDAHEQTTSAGEMIWQARQAARLGLRVGWTRKRIEWSEVGQYRGMSNLPEAFLHSHFLTADLERFLNSAEHAELVDTLERFLIHAGNIQAVASESFLHRTTVYHRLRRIEALLGVDLSRGHDRLELHTGLLAWRLLHQSIGSEKRQPPRVHFAG